MVVNINYGGFSPVTKPLYRSAQCYSPLCYLREPLRLLMHPNSPLSAKIPIEILMVWSWTSSSSTAWSLLEMETLSLQLRPPSQGRNLHFNRLLCDPGAH